MENRVITKIPYKENDSLVVILCFVSRSTHDKRTEKKNIKITVDKFQFDQSFLEQLDGAISQPLQTFSYLSNVVLFLLQLGLNGFVFRPKFVRCLLFQIMEQLYGIIINEIYLRPAVYGENNLTL